MTVAPLVRITHVIAAARDVMHALSRKLVPPPVALLEMASGFMATHALFALARLGVADVLTHGPMSGDEVAERTQSNHDAMKRLLRACAALGVLHEDAHGQFVLTSLGEELRSTTPRSMLPVILMLGDPRYQGPWGELPYTVRTGSPGAERALGTTMWEFLEHDQEFASIFNDAMGRLCELDFPTIEMAYDFSSFMSIVDIGGGGGQLLALILAAAPSARGVLMERASLMDKAADQLREAGMLPRCRMEAGSFFESAPDDGDLYVMRHVIHDFDDEEATLILSNIRLHMPINATLLLMESVLPPGNKPHFAKLLDLDMMIFVGGRERTEAEFTALLSRAGFRATRIIPTMSTISLIEATKSEES